MKMTNILIVLSLVPFTGCPQKPISLDILSVSDWDQVEHSLTSLRDAMIQNQIVSITVGSNDNLLMLNSYDDVDFKECIDCLGSDMHESIKSELDEIGFHSAFFDIQTGDFQILADSLKKLNTKNGDYFGLVLDPQQRFKVGEEINYYNTSKPPFMVNVMDRSGGIVLLLHRKPKHWQY